MKYHTYVLIYPFIGEKGGLCGYSKISENLFLMDFCLSVDVSFYQFIYTEMMQTNNILIARLNDDQWSWNTCNGDSMIRIMHKNDVFTTLDFEAWYTQGAFQVSDYTIEIIHPDLYTVPFPLKSLVFKLNQNGDPFLLQY